MQLYLLNVDVKGWKVNILLLTLFRFCFFLMINPIMQMNTIHNPIIPLVMESTIITNGAESVVEIILNVAFIVVIKVTMVLAWDVDVTS